MDKLCCVLNGIKIEYECTCNLKWHYPCSSPFQKQNSEFFDGYNALADYHFLNAPECKAAQAYTKRWKLQLLPPPYGFK